jgi:hypothetical protein
MSPQTQELLMPIFAEMGVIVYPLMIYTGATLVALWSHARSPKPAHKSRLRAWGLATLLLGLLGTLLDLQTVASALLYSSAENRPLLMAAGLRIALKPLVWGALVATAAMTGGALIGIQLPRIQLQLHAREEKREEPAST